MHTKRVDNNITFLEHKILHKISCWMLGSPHKWHFPMSQQINNTLEKACKQNWYLYFISHIDGCCCIQCSSAICFHRYVVYATVVEGTLLSLRVSSGCCYRASLGLLLETTQGTRMWAARERYLTHCICPSPHVDSPGGVVNHLKCTMRFLILLFGNTNSRKAPPTLLPHPSGLDEKWVSKEKVLIWVTIVRDQTIYFCTLTIYWTNPKNT